MRIIKREEITSLVIRNAGAQGPRGDTGPQGEQGLQGEQGESGRVGLNIPVGYYWQPDGSTTLTSVNYTVARRGYFSMFVVPFPMSISELRFQVSTPGGVLHAGIYDLDVTGTLPGALVADLGICEATATGGTGPRGYTGIDVEFTRAGIYWMMVAFDAVTSLQTLAMLGPNVVTAEPKSSLQYSKGYYSTAPIVAAIDSPLPSTAPALTQNQATTSNQVVMELRRSA